MKISNPQDEDNLKQAKNINQLQQAIIYCVL
jgi:hypothetical protein